MRRCLCVLLVVAGAQPVAWSDDDVSATPAEAAESVQPAEEVPAAEEPEAPEATHHQTEIIQLKGDEEIPQINAFCLNAAGEILAACGDGPGLVCVADSSGRVIRTWPIDVRPEAISVAEDGTILVGGAGRLFRFTSSGECAHEEESPHAAALKENAEKIREEAIEFLVQQSQQESRAVIYQSILDQLTEKAKNEELSDDEQRVLDQLPELLEFELKKEEAKKKAEANPEEEEEFKPEEKDIERTVERLVSMRMRISSVSSAGDHVFVATGSQEGYGFDVWKLNGDLTGGEIIVTGLRGCCGQMDVQCCSNGVFVAENGRHRVARYDDSGTMVTSWGSRDRKGVDGFSSCCNPMNVCFAGNGDVLTAESNTGLIKRFTADGEMVSFVGQVDLVPGCKNVSIAISPQGDRIYMLDLTRNHIVVMEQGSGDSGTEAASS